MKTVSVLLVALLLTSCEITFVEPVVDTRNLFTGTYRVEEYSQTYNEVCRYTIYLQSSGSRYDVVIDNFYNANLRVQAEIRGDKLYVHRQVVNGYEIDGVGTLFTRELELNYRVRDLWSNRPADFCELRAWPN